MFSVSGSCAWRGYKNRGQIKHEFQLENALKGSRCRRESSAAVILMMILVVCVCPFMNILCLTALGAILK